MARSHAAGAVRRAEHIHARHTTRDTLSFLVELLSGTTFCAGFVESCQCHLVFSFPRRGYHQFRLGTHRTLQSSYVPAHNSFGITSGKRDNHMEEAHKLPRGRSCCCRRLRLPRELSSSCVASPPYYCCYCLQALRESRNAGVVGAAVRLHLPRFRLGSSTASSCRGEVSGFPPGTCARLSRRTCEEGPGHQQSGEGVFESWDVFGRKGVSAMGVFGKDSFSAPSTVAERERERERESTVETRLRPPLTPPKQRNGYYCTTHRLILVTTCTAATERSSLAGRRVVCVSSAHQWSQVRHPWPCIHT